MTQKTILITGGAGYIGSHTARQLGARGDRIVTLDNLIKGYKNAVTYGDLIVGNTGDAKIVTQILRDYEVDTVIHFAAHTIVPESVTDPLKYYANNTCSTRTLLECCIQEGVKNFIFSSTAAVYGTPKEPQAYEDAPLKPINPYGTSKLMTELMLQDVGAVTDLNYVILRYFNVAGSDPKGRIGQRTPEATLLIKVACEVAVGKREALYIFGTDYNSPDGTGVRDYIHVEDLAQAHLDALDYLKQGGESTILNVGYGHGYSVREVADAVSKANGSPIKVIEEARRAGDPAVLIAGADKIKSTIGWTPQYDDLDAIVTHSLNWERKMLNEEKGQ